MSPHSNKNIENIEIQEISGNFIAEAARVERMNGSSGTYLILV